MGIFEPRTLCSATIYPRYQKKVWSFYYTMVCLERWSWAQSEIEALEVRVLRNIEKDYKLQGKLPGLKIKASTQGLKLLTIVAVF